MRAIKSYNYLFIDESGEFGVSPESSDGLIVVALKTNEVRPIEKVARKVWVSTGLDKSKAQEIHAADANDRIITKALSLLNKQEIQVDVLVYKKRKDKNIDIHDVYYQMLQEIIISNKNAFSITIDKRDTKKKRTNMINQLSHSHVFDRVKFEDSKKVKPLQIVDVVAWAVFQDVEFRIDKFILLLDKSKIMYRKFTPKRKPSALTNH